MSVFLGSPRWPGVKSRLRLGGHQGWGGGVPRSPAPDEVAWVSGAGQQFVVLSSKNILSIRVGLGTNLKI